MSNRVKILSAVVVAVLVGGAGIYFGQDWLRQQFFKPTQSEIPAGITSKEVSEVDVIDRNLTVPWGLAFLPDGAVLATERNGVLRHIEGGNTYNIDGVKHIGEGGLLGLALHPNFDENYWIYLYMTTENNDGLSNRVERYKFSGDNLKDREVIIDDIPGAQYHDGGRIAFGPDGKLYITTGDAGQDDLAQSTSSLAGKILRLNDDGSIPSDNPFDNPVYSYGHRNPQGLAWDEKGKLWSTEHGRSGLRSGYDELNLIKRGANYGWPVIEGDESQSGMEPPILHSGADETWAPASLAYFDGSLFFGGLRGESIYEVVMSESDDEEVVAHFREDYGRIRTVEVGPDGKIYFTTSNTDGRGEQMAGDDKIIRIDPDIF